MGLVRVAECARVTSTMTSAMKLARRAGYALFGVMNNFGVMNGTEVNVCGFGWGN